MPIVLGYTWLIIASFSNRTEGLFPKDAAGGIGGWTLDNWSFLADPPRLAFDLELFHHRRAGMVVGVGFISSLAGYALSRMNFTGRRSFLSLTLILHAFPGVTLLIAIFFVLRFTTRIPGIGPLFGLQHCRWCGPGDDQPRITAPAYG